MNTAAAIQVGAPDWDELFSIAQAYSGYFTTAQAAKAGYSLPLLHKYLVNGRVLRVRRGIYRLVHFPASEHEDLVVLSLWADQAGVFSHETALALQPLRRAALQSPHHGSGELAPSAASGTFGSRPAL
jgi:predicted transcriptional regulator of viral defense system